jgi:hypothetical protein
VDPVIMAIQSTPAKIRRARIDQAFELMEDTKPFLAERAQRIIKHLLR